MVYIVVLLEVKDAELFRTFENAAIIIMKKYGGSLQVAFQPDENFSSSKNVDEVHQLQFPDIESFKRYRVDPELKELTELRIKAIANTTVLVSGKKISY